MAMKCEAIVPEVEVKFPAVMYGDVNGAKVLAINKDIAIPERGGVLSFTHLVDRYIPCPPGSKFVMKITAEDGSEWPRIERHRDFGTRWLCVENTAFAARRGSVAMALDSCMGKPPGRVEPAVACTPLPPGTITTITFCDGVWTCEIQEPVEEIPLADALKRMDEGETLRMVHGNFSSPVNKHNAYAFGIVHDSRFYEVDYTTPQPTPEPAAEKEPDWLPMTIQGVKVHRNYLGNLGVDEVGFSPEYARQLSEVAARFADEQEFPGESLPIEWEDENGYVFRHAITKDGELDTTTSTIRTVEDADRAMRALRLYKRHLQDQAKD